MHSHLLRQIIESCDRAILAKNFDSQIEHYSEDAAKLVKLGIITKGKDNIRKVFIVTSDYLQEQLIVKQGEMQIIEDGRNVPVIMEALLRFPLWIGSNG